MTDFVTEVAETPRSILITRSGAFSGAKLVVRVSMDEADWGPDPTFVSFEGAMVLTGAVYDDLRVRIDAARDWLIQARGDVRLLRELITTI